MIRNLPILLVLFCASVSCTTYKEFDATTGNQTLAFSTSANIGIATSDIRGSNSATSGIPLLGGGYQDTVNSVAVANSEPTKIKVGQMEIVGTVDSATTIDRTGGWIWRTVRTVVTGAVFKEGIGAWRADRLAGHTKDVNMAGIQGKTTQLANQGATDVAIRKLETDAAVQLAKP